MKNKKGEIREVITNEGILYYQIEQASIYDHLFLFTKRIKKTNIKIFGKNFNIHNKVVYDIIEGPNNNGSYHLSKDGDRVENIKKTIDGAISVKENFDPEWDGIMCSDAALLRDLLLTKILSEQEQEKLLKNEEIK